MNTEKQKPISKVIVCMACKSPLWKLTILTYFKATKSGEQPIVGSTQWESMNAKVTTREPKSWDCPVCTRPFVGIKVDDKGKERRFMRYWHPEIRQSTDELID